jgi:hypothetical protein
MSVSSFYTMHPCFRSTKIGAAFHTLSDTASRTAFGATEVLVGLITALLGGPFFFVICGDRCGIDAKDNGKAKRRERFARKKQETY